jgi:hypothetical protein
MSLGLKNGGDSDFLRTKNSGDLGEDTGTILDFEADIETPHGFSFSHQLHLSPGFGKGGSGRFVV